MPLNLLGSLSDQDVGDLGIAVKNDPSLLEAPDHGWAGDLARAANGVTRIFGLMFHDEDALKVSALHSLEFQQEDQEAIQRRLIPVIGEARAARQEQARQDHLEQQAYQNQLRAESAQRQEIELENHISQNWGIRGPDGKMRDLTPEEVQKYKAYTLDAYNDPLKHLIGPSQHPFPEGMEAYGPAQRQADRDAMLDKRQDFQREQDFRRQAALIDRKAAADQKLADKAAEVERGKQEKGLIRSYDQRVTEATRLISGSANSMDPEERVKRATDTTSQLAIGEGIDALKDPTRWEYPTYLRRLASDMGKSRAEQFAIHLDEQAMREYGAESAYPKTVKDFLRAYHDILPAYKKK